MPFTTAWDREKIEIPLFPGATTLSALQGLAEIDPPRSPHRKENHYERHHLAQASSLYWH